MSQFLTIVAWLSAAAFLLVIALLVAIQLLMPYLARQIHHASNKVAKLQHRNDMSEASLRDRTSQVANLERDVADVLVQIKTTDDRLREIIAHSHRENDSEHSRLAAERNRLRLKAEDLQRRARALGQDTDEAIAEEQAKSIEVRQLKRLIQRTHKLLRIVELIGNIDVAGARRPEAPK